ncbi:uncharacterized protein FA14DRAFT_159378 [Meira miltonrushii]|uniref:SART-1 protein n=1 Tax=Meira miltonrushii TaxID=1280837 RepID=A0A316VMA7_9BASI|nr:uncharacterized protein FA14DRAFT_159378 [Meira miltonrushii]PWN37231.1 hypothetical protein FA14DRAFT_159378 [Meira miltonrushii]
MSEFQKDELSLEETNKLRIQLGLKPLAPDSDDEDSKQTQKNDKDDDDPLKNQEEKAAKNYADWQESQRKQKEDEKVKERIAKAQNRRDLNKRLQGRTLGDADEIASTSNAEASTSDSNKKWLKAQRKKALANEARRRQEEEEAEAAASAAAKAKYDSEDLRGLKVGHDMEEFDLEEGGEGKVLTLRDSKILDNDDDELMDSTLDQKERDRINEERKKGVKQYTGLDDDDFDAGNVGRPRGVLSKYDADVEHLDGPLPKDADAGFRLGGEVRTRKDRDEAKRKESERAPNRTLLNLDYTKNEEVSDYLQEGDVGFKKPKARKKKRETARIRLDDDDEDRPADNNGGKEDVEMNEDGVSAAPSESRRQPRQRNTEIDLIDDDDLALSLAKARRKQAKKAFQKMTPEMIARNLAEQKAAEEAEKNAANSAESMNVDVKPAENESNAGLTFDETSNFVHNLQAARDASPEIQSRPRQSSTPQVKREESAEIESGINGFDASDMLVEDPNSALPSVKEEEDVDMDIKEEAPALPTTVEEVEPLVSGGLGSTLSLLRNQGLITEMTPEQREREKQQKEYDAWMATRRAEDRAREAELAASKAQGSAKDQATREYENRKRELEDARKVQDRFKDYKPDFEIKYHDEFGRTLNNHEAWKRLSHIFHGKAPGKKKQEQRLQRIELEKKREKMLAGDTPTGMTKAFAERAEKSGQAHMVLGVGAKNNAPQDAGLLGPNTVAHHSNRNAGHGKGKSKQSEDYTREGSTSSQGGSYHVSPESGRDSGSGFASDMNGITSMVPRSTTTKVKAGFAPIARPSPLASSSSSQPHRESDAASGANGQTNTQQPSGKFKLAFGKRPAPSSGASNGPPAKQAREM